MPLPAGHPPFSSFSSFHGVRAAKPLFYWLECRFVIFAIFVKNPLFLAGQKHGLPKAPFSGLRLNFERVQFGLAILSRFSTIRLGQKSCRTKVSRILRIVVPNFPPNFPRIFRGFFVHWSAVKKGARRERDPQKSSRNFVSETGRFGVQISLYMTPMEGTALFRRRILGQYLAAPCSPGPFVLLLNWQTMFATTRRPEKINQNSPPFFNATSPGKYEKNIHKVFLESRQS